MILKRNSGEKQAHRARRSLVRRTSAFVLFLFSLVLAPPAFANNTFPGTAISGNSGSLTATNVGATGEAGEPATYGGGNLNTMWYSWTAPSGGSLTVQTCSATITTFDTTLQAFVGAAVNALGAAVATNDDACANTTVNPYASLITFDVVSGTTYRIQVDGYASGTGTFLLSWAFTPRTVVIANTTNGNEAGPVSGVMTLTQSSAAATATVIAYTVSGTATSGADFTALSGTVTIAAGATTATIPIPVINDAIVEGSETVIVTLTGVTSGAASLGAAVAATNTIADNDSATVTIANTTNGAEPATNGQMTVTQTAVSAANTVIAYSVGGTAASGSDYTALSGTVTIPAGSTTAAIPIPVLNDSIVEPGETVIVTLTSVTSGLATLGATLIATNTITSDDAAAVSVANTTNAAEPATDGVLTVTQTNASATNTVIAYSVAGTAISGTDYTALSGTVTIPAGSTSATISIPVLDDAVVEGGESVIVTLTGITSGLATLGAPLVATNTIADNDAATVTIANSAEGAEAGPVNGVITVSQSSLSATNTIVSYSVSGTATSGADFTALSGTVTIPAGSASATVSIPVINDAIVEGSETVVVTLTSVTSGLATLGATLIATNTIADNDSATVTVANTTNAAEPAANGVMTLTQTAVSSQATVISYTVGGTATSASDFTALSGTVTIPAGAVTATISIPVLDDAIVEGGETVVVTLTSVTSGLATLGATLVASNTIADNDAATVSIANTTNAAEPATNGVMTLTQTAVSSQATVISYTVGGTATAASDFTALSGTVTIPAGAVTATITISVVDDLIVDPGETVIITLTSVSSGLATLGAPLVATNTIGDNDIASFTIAKAVNTANVTTPLTLTYTITIDNTGNVPLTGLSITDTLLQGASPRVLTSGPAYASGDTNTDGVLDASETWIYGATYAVPQSDIDNGAAISNTANFDTAETAAQTSNPAATTITQSPALSIDKAADTAGPLTAGQVINYSYQVTNTGNITVSAVSVAETAFNGNGLPVPSPVAGGPTTLAPGGTVTFTASYTVTQADIDLLQ